ncbi:MAG TPA: GAF domain-containing protein [Actinomycetota bacterium]
MADADLQAELERLRRRAADERFAEELSAILSLAAAAGKIASPVGHTRLLRMIVETAAQVCSAESGGLLLVDPTAGDLIFEVAYGPKAQEVARFRVPLGQGIAGLVAVSGQAMAVAEGETDPRVARDIGETIGYVPDSILCVPMFHTDRVIGVLELLNKNGGGSFSPADMELLGRFANQAAVAIELSRTYQHVAPMLAELLGSLTDAAALDREALLERAEAFAASMEEDEAYRETIELSALVQRIAWTGDAEREMVRSVLQSLADYLAARNPRLHG